MDITKVEMELFCEKCNEDTVHVITYAGQKVITKFFRIEKEYKNIKKELEHK